MTSTDPSKYPELNDRRWLFRKYKLNKKSVREIADIVGCSYDTVHYHIDRHDIPTRSQGEALRENIEELENKNWLKKKYVEENWSTLKIANELGCDQRTVHRALKRHAIEVRSHAESVPRGEEHHFFRHGDSADFSYGEGWESSRAKAKERDNHQCQWTECEVNEQEHEQKYGLGLHVHHIIPARLIDDPQKRNDVGNLVTLCGQHHGVVEKRVPGKPSGVNRPEGWWKEELDKYLEKWHNGAFSARKVGMGRKQTKILDWIETE